MRIYVQYERQVDFYRPVANAGGAKPEAERRDTRSSERERAHAREAFLAAVPVRERAEMRKMLQQEEEEEALRQARITAAAERRMAVERARARMMDAQEEEAPVGGCISVAVPPPMPRRRGKPKADILKSQYIATL